MTSKTFVLGAGFSADARFPLARDLKDEVIKFAERTPYKIFLRPGNRGFEKGQFYAGLEAVDPGGSLQFEELLTTLLARLKQTDSGDPCHITLKVLRTVWAELFWNLQSSLFRVPACYESFAKWAIGNGDAACKDAVVSFNWDLLVERILTDYSLPWSYAQSEDSVIPVLKPHGSINWNGYLRGNLSPTYAGWRPVVPGSKLSYDAFHPLSNPDREGINPDLRYMIFPGDTESAEADPDLQLIWDSVARVIAERDSIVFIGYSLPAYDSFSGEFLSRWSKGKTVEVYNPSEEHLERFRAVFGNRTVLVPSRLEQSKYGRNPS